MCCVCASKFASEGRSGLSLASQKNLGFVRIPGFCPTSGSVERADFYGEQVRTSKAGDRATGKNGDTCRTRVHPNSATYEGKAGAIAACSHVLPQDAQCHWREKGLKRLRRSFVEKRLMPHKARNTVGARCLHRGRVTQHPALLSTNTSPPPHTHTPGKAQKVIN